MALLPRPSHSAPVEAWWKQESANFCVFPTSLANTRPGTVPRNYRKLRNLSRFSAIVHGSFATTHNLKVTGSNPVPATDLSSNNKDLRCF